MIRLFIGIELPDELLRRMVLIQTGFERAKWVRKQTFT
jgi:2'-5' RNA ligase